ncbi:MAG: DUF58 domain-containing protein [Pseudomonadales bacterium]|nr:DUF58 domain-containing protein [Pseudomonadales bacterium]
MQAIPSRLLLWFALAFALLAGGAWAFALPLILVSVVAVLLVAALLAATGLDYFVTRRAWRQDGLRYERRMPAALAVGVPTQVIATVRNPGVRNWSVTLFDFIDAGLHTDDMPRELQLVAGTATEFSYRVRAAQRGDVQFAPAMLRLRSRGGLLDLQVRLGEFEQRRVYPDFAELARYAWLTGSNRLNEIGIKTFHQRGAGTDFKQLSEYQAGDPIRHIDWKATLRLQKPIVRQFQDERDQRVMLLIDCGRRMRADDREGAGGRTHFDQVLNAVMLLSYVALKRGDAVGAMTFGTPPGEGRFVAPCKGLQTVETVMGQLYAVQPTPTHSDYQLAAEEFMRRQPKRALVIIVTNFRDEDAAELGDALRLLRSRHLVLLASLREQIVQQVIEQPLTSRAAAVAVASAHLYAEARRKSFARLAARDGLMVDVEPPRLGVELVNRYNAVKKAGLL